MSDLTPGPDPLFPVYSPGCNFVKGYVYEDEAKGYKLQGLYGMSGNLVGFVTNSFSDQVLDQTWDQAWAQACAAPEISKPKAKKKNKQGIGKTDDVDITKVLEDVKKFWTAENQDKCGKNYEAIAESHKKSRSQRRYEAVVEPSLQPKSSSFPRTWADVYAVIVALQKDFDKQINCLNSKLEGANQHYSDAGTVLQRKLINLEQELNKHKIAIDKLQSHLPFHDLVAVTTVPVIPIPKRRKIKANGHRQEDNG
jgi:hypothetical protein